MTDFGRIAKLVPGSPREPFWSHFGDHLVALCFGVLPAPFGSLLAPFWLPLAHFGLRWGAVGSIWHPFGTFVAPFSLPAAPWWCPLGSVFPSGILAAFCMYFKCIFPCLAVCGSIWLYLAVSTFFFLMILNERSARASEASRARSSSSNARLEPIIPYSFREWHSKRFKLLMLIRAPARGYV